MGQPRLSAGTVHDGAAVPARQCAWDMLRSCAQRIITVVETLTHVQQTLHCFRARSTLHHTPLSNIVQILAQVMALQRTARAKRTSKKGTYVCISLALLLADVPCNASSSCDLFTPC